MFAGASLVSDGTSETETSIPPEWQVVFTRTAQKDALDLASAGLRPEAETLMAILRVNPFQTPPPYEKLSGDLAGAYPRRINIQHRLVYAVDKDAKLVKVLRMWTHYE